MLTPEMCRAARAFLKWKVHQLASAAGLAEATVRRFEASGLVRPASVEAMIHALQGAGVELIPAGGKSLEGGPGVRMIPLVEPEVAAAEEAFDLAEPALSVEMEGSVTESFDQGDRQCGVGVPSTADPAVGPVRDIA